MKQRIYLLFFTLFLLFSCKAYPPRSSEEFIPRSAPNEEALLKSARDNELEGVQKALNQGASNKNLALFWATLYDDNKSHEEVIRFLTEKGAKDDSPNKFNITAKDIVEGRANGKFLRTIKADGRFFLLPKGYVSCSQYENNGENTKPLGKGSQGTAFLVYRLRDLSLWAPKFPNDALEKPDYAADVDDAFDAAQVKRNKDFGDFEKDDQDVILSMQYGFGNPVEVKVGFTPASTTLSVGDIPYAMKTGITGGTLKEHMSTGLFVAQNDKKAEEMRKDLPELFMRMAHGKKAYFDLNPDNIMWKYNNPKKEEEGGQWVIIDAKPPDNLQNKGPLQIYSFGEAWEKNLEYFRAKLPYVSEENGWWDEGAFTVYVTNRTAAQRIVNAGLYLPDPTLATFKLLRAYFANEFKVNYTEVNTGDLPDKFSKLTRHQKISIFLSNKGTVLEEEKLKEIREFIVEKALKVGDQDAQDFLYFGIGNTELAAHFSEQTDPKLDAVRAARNAKIKEIIEDTKNRKLSLEEVLKKEHNRYRKALVMLPEEDINGLGLEALALRKELLVIRP